MFAAIKKANQYIETHRNEVNPQYRHHYHLMAPTGWINDPNGFVYFNGFYHLFYQYYPYDSVWGPMHWGHARSQDLVHWEELPVALAPSEDYDRDGCFSGSAIEKDGKLYLLYTGHVVKGEKTRQVQCLAVSEDGIHFEKSPANPVISEEHVAGVADTVDFRDPKVFAQNDRYYTVVAAKTPDSRGQILLFESRDLVDWQFTSVLLEGSYEQGIMWECPDLFTLDGHDVLLVSPIQMKAQGVNYRNTSSSVAFIGSVDWQTGTFQVANYHEIDHGLDFYAPQTCQGASRRIMIAWMQMWNRTFPTHDLGHHWAGAMTLPRELRVKDLRLEQRPVAEVYQSLTQVKHLGRQLQDETLTLATALPSQGYLKLRFDLTATQSLTLRYGQKEALVITYDGKTHCLSVDRSELGYPIVGAEEPVLTGRSLELGAAGLFELECFRDTASLELFVNGTQTMTTTFYERQENQTVTLHVVGTGIIKEIITGEID